MNEIKTLAKQTVIYGLGTIIPRFLNYAVLTPFYTRIFTNTSDYGVITEIYAWMVLLLVVLTYGMETTFFRFAQKSDEPQKVYSTALISLLATSLLFIILVNVFIGKVSEIMNYQNNHDYIRMFSVIVAIDAFTAIPFAKLRRENRPVMFSAIKLINVFVSLSMVFFLLSIAPAIYEKSHGWFRHVYNPDYKVGYVFVANLVSSCVTLLLVTPFIIRIKLIFDRVLWNRMIIYAFPLLIAGIGGSVNDSLDKVILRRFLGDENGLAIVGKYGAAFKIGVLMGLVIQMFRFAAEPFFFERAKKENAKETYADVMKYFIIIMLIIYLAINLYLPGIQYIVGSNYRDAIFVVPIVSMSYLLYGIYINHSIWFKLNDLTIYAVYITLVGAFITVLINVTLIPVAGYIAAAWGHVGSYGAMIIMSFIFAEKHYKINYRIKTIVPYFIVAVGMVVFSQVYHYGSILKELIVNTMFFAGFIAFTQYKDKTLSVFLKRKNT